ncbi:MarR family winged helix-turn-helix transcriptional regulator [Ahrensia kielensis]|uniref:MarR family winged helix-turn-helix transcriptional regulator n=1 Tax=Ahrensia kielensis TaxID=76980 RepID=UPI000380A284|nr:MarR family transcriptional regulator [Ahrensia kielensis]
MARYFIETPDDEHSGTVLGALQNAARFARTHTARHLLETGLYAGQETIISLLAEHETLTPSQIAKYIGVRPPTITKSIGRLTEQGFVTKSTGHTDGRHVHVELTEAGRDILKKVRKAAKKAEKQALKGFSDSQIKQFEIALNQLSTNLVERDEKALKKAAKRASSDS